MKWDNARGVSRLEVVLILLLLCIGAATLTVFLGNDESARQASSVPETARPDDSVKLEYEIDDKAVSLLPGSGRSGANSGKAVSRSNGATNGGSAASTTGTNGISALPVPKELAGAASGSRLAGASSTVKASPAKSGSDKTASSAQPGKSSKPGTAAARPDLIRIQPDLAEALLELEQQEWSRETEVRLLGVINTLAVQDPQAALEYALLIERRGTRNAALAGALGIWARQAPDAAYEWFRTRATGTPGRLESQTRPLFDILATRNVNTALSMVWGLPTDNMKRIALGTIAGRMISTGNEGEVLALYDSVGVADKGVVLDVLLQSMGRYAPNRLGQLASSLQDAKARSRALDTLVSIWASDHPGAAAAWVATGLPSDADRARQIDRVTSAWVKEDPVKTAHWLLSLFPASGQTDPAVGSFARAMMGDNPGYAGTWSFTVTDSKQRWKLMEDIGRSWLKTDPARAKLYIQKTDLPVKTKDVLLKLK